MFEGLPASRRPGETPTLRLARRLGLPLDDRGPSCVMGWHHVEDAAHFATVADGRTLAVCETHRESLDAYGVLIETRPVAPAQERLDL